jgi:hypothetical protein
MIEKGATLKHFKPSLYNGLVLITDKISRLQMFKLVYKLVVGLLFLGT